MSLIGLFDSGVGGLTVWRVVDRLLPEHDLVYFADQKYCPYGPRPRPEILSRSRHIAEFLIAEGCRTIVVACNTASAAALQELRANHPDIRFVGMEPAVKPAVHLTRSGIVGVLATEGTLEGDLYLHTRQESASGIQVVANTAPGLVEQIEHGDIDSDTTREIVRQAIEPLVAGGADVIVLGCTHYPLIAKLIRENVGDSVVLVDPSEAVAHQVARVVGHGASREGESARGDRVFYTSGDNVEFERVIMKLAGVTSRVHQVN